MRISVVKVSLFTITTTITNNTPLPNITQRRDNTSRVFSDAPKPKRIRLDGRSLVVPWQIHEQYLDKTTGYKAIDHISITNFP